MTVLDRTRLTGQLFLFLSEPYLLHSVIFRGGENMSSYKIIRSFFIFFSLILAGSILPAYSHVLSDNPPGFWGLVDEDFYESINNIRCDVEEFGRLKKKITIRRNKIKSRVHNVDRFELRLSSLQARITALQQEILELKDKLSSFNVDEDKQKGILVKIKRKQRKISYLQRDTVRQGALINITQVQINLIRPKLVQAEKNYGNLNVACGSIDSDESIFNKFDFYQFEGNARKISVALQDDIPYELTFRRIDALPSQCLSTLRNNPIGNFEAFAGFFDEHYPFFELYDVDWDIETSLARVLVNKNTSDQALFDILTTMLAKVKDGHILLEATIKGKDVEFDAHPFDIDLAIAQYADKKGIDIDVADDLFLDNYLIKDIKNHILGRKLFSDPEEIVFYGMTSGDIGYIAITEEDIIGDNPLEDIEITNAFMDDAITYFKANNAKAVIIDLSINHGGFDSVARSIAERFASQSTIGYTKRAGDFLNAQEIDISIEPSTRERFLGPVYLITSEATISAGEILVLSLRALPNVTHVGESTNGALSDQLEKELPNGWIISLSSEIYTGHHGVEWESVGIEPDILMPVFDLENPMGSAHRDAIDAVIELIDQEHP